MECYSGNLPLDYATTANAVKTRSEPSDSSFGKFGWVTIGHCHIPFIFRSGEKYCCMRMVQVQMFSEHLRFLQKDVLGCVRLNTHPLMPCEAWLLDEINIEHCDLQFGSDRFSHADTLIHMDDAVELYKFVDVCYNMLCHTSTPDTNKCGFICINGESVVPFTVRNRIKYVPLFYFEGETDTLHLKAVVLDGWDLAYLKFCCKIQGVCNELFANDTCLVVSLQDIQSYFPPDTLFKEFWPSNQS